MVFFWKILLLTILVKYLTILGFTNMYLGIVSALWKKRKVDITAVLYVYSEFKESQKNRKRRSTNNVNASYPSIIAFNFGVAVDVYQSSFLVALLRRI